MRITVIVPMYNVESYIRDCVESLCSQQVEMEIILIDDGSTDDTYKVASSLAAQYSEIKLIHQENHGQGTARNVGLKHATGEYILFCDSDDMIADNSLKPLINLMDQYKLDYIKTGWLTKYSDKTVVNSPVGISLNQVMSSERYFEEAIDNWYNVVPWNGLYRRSFLKKNDIVFPENIQFEDNTFSLKVYLSQLDAQMMQTEIPFYIVRVSENSTTTARPKAKKINDQLENIRLMEEFISQSELPDKLKQSAQIAVSSLVSTMVRYYYRMSAQERKKVSIPSAILKRAYMNPQEKSHGVKIFLFCHCRWLLNLIYH